MCRVGGPDKQSKRGAGIDLLWGRNGQYRIHRYDVSRRRLRDGGAVTSSTSRIAHSRSSSARNSASTSTTRSTRAMADRRPSACAASSRRSTNRPSPERWIRYGHTGMHCSNGLARRTTCRTHGPASGTCSRDGNSRTKWGDPWTVRPRRLQLPATGTTGCRPAVLPPRHPVAQVRGSTPAVGVE